MHVVTVRSHLTHAVASAGEGSLLADLLAGLNDETLSSRCALSRLETVVIIQLE